MALDPELHPYLEKVNRAPSPDGWHFDPAALTRAVNALHSLGDARACLVLEEYVNRAEGEREQTDESLDAFRVLLIIRLLFVSRTDGTSLPALALGQPDIDLPRQDDAWPHLPLVVSQDLPFLLVGGYFVGGSRRSPLHYVNTYAAEGRLRDAPLTPQGSPVEAVESLVASADWSRLVPSAQEARVRVMLYGQALRAAEPAYVVDEADYQAMATLPPEKASALWEQHAEAIQALQLRWDASAKDFTSARHDIEQ